MGDVKTLLAKYTPPDLQKIEQAFKSCNVSLDPNSAAQRIGIVFRNYAQSGDQMTLSFDMATKKISALDVNTYLDDPNDVVTLAVIEWESLSRSMSNPRRIRRCDERARPYWL